MGRGCRTRCVPGTGAAVGRADRHVAFVHNVVGLGKTDVVGVAAQLLHHVVLGMSGRAGGLTPRRLTGPDVLTTDHDIGTATLPHRRLPELADAPLRDVVGFLERLPVGTTQEPLRRGTHTRPNVHRGSTQPPLCRPDQIAEQLLQKGPPAALWVRRVINQAIAATALPATCQCQPRTADSGCVLFYTCVMARRWKYSTPRTYRMVHVDVDHLSYLEVNGFPVWPGLLNANTESGS
jgi:hypothetical protein